MSEKGGGWSLYACHPRSLFHACHPMSVSTLSAALVWYILPGQVPQPTFCYVDEHPHRSFWFDVVQQSFHCGASLNDSSDWWLWCVPSPHQPAGAPASTRSTSRSRMRWQDGNSLPSPIPLLNTAWADLVVGSPCKLEQASSFLELVFPQNLFISSRSTSELALMWSYLLSQQQDEKATSIVSTQHIQRGIWPTSQQAGRRCDEDYPAMFWVGHWAIN